MPTDRPIRPHGTTEEPPSRTIPRPVNRRKLPHGVIVRAPGLLPMRYRPAELAVELGVPARTIRDWVDRGLPHAHDRRGHLWIEGRAFARWVEAERRAGFGLELADGEAYCLACRRPVALLNPSRTTQGKRALLQGACPHCGKPVHRGVRHG